MKKAIALCTSAVLCLSLLASCGNSNANQSDAPSAPPAQSENVQTSSAPEASAPDLAAFGQDVLKNHNMADYLERLDPKDEELGAIMLENYYPGLKDMDLEQLEAYMAMVSFSGGEFILAQAKSAEDAAKVKEMFQARIDSKTTEGVGNYPEEVEMWQRSANLVEQGNYIMLICHDDAEAIVGEFNALFA